MVRAPVVPNAVGVTSPRPPVAFGALPRAPKPVLLLIVYGLFLVVVGVTATAQTILVSEHFSNAALTEVVGSDAGTVRSFVNLNLLESDLDGRASPERQVQLAQALASLIRNGNLAHIEIRRPDGVIAVSEDVALEGRQMPVSADFATALAGTIAPNVVRDGVPPETAAALAEPALLREYLPVSSAGQIRAVVGVWRDAGPILAALDDVRRQVVLVTISGALVAAIFLFFVFRAAQGRISRQTAQLMESTRRDPLTNLLNHGALVTALAERIERARGAEEAIGIALVDLDGFRLLNDTYGHDAGDAALLQVADRLPRQVDGSAVVGRYGPDEFLVIVDTLRVASLEPAVEGLRGVLAGESLEVEAEERLPLTVSAGICTYPADADSATALLALAVQTLNEAKASGGDAIRVAGRVPVASADVRTFDVFQGLILAVDAKDRYTKRHSEDVSRYAVFLARRLGLDAETVRTIRLVSPMPSTTSSSSTLRSATWSSVTCPGSSSSGPASVTTTNGGTAAATSMPSPGRRSRSSPGSSVWPTPSRQ
jgi:diguanylate cyclase (GGDEF)-like protein